VPSKQHLAAVGLSSRSTSRASVDLPQPDSPTTPVTWPRGTSRSTSLTAVIVRVRPNRPRRLLKRRVRPRTCTRVIKSGRGQPWPWLNGKWQATRPLPGPLRSRQQRHGGAGTAALRQRAARVEAAAAGVVGDAGHHAGNALEAAAGLAGGGDAADQRAV
jgi:hypothetical protein